MSALLFLLPLAIVLGGVFVALFLVAAQDGQFDDLDEDARRAVEEN